MCRELKSVINFDMFAPAVSRRHLPKTVSASHLLGRNINHSSGRLQRRGDNRQIWHTLIVYYENQSIYKYYVIYEWCAFSAMHSACRVTNNVYSRATKTVIWSGAHFRVFIIYVRSQN